MKYDCLIIDDEKYWQTILVSILICLILRQSSIQYG